MDASNNKKNNVLIIVSVIVVILLIVFCALLLLNNDNSKGKSNKDNDTKEVNNKKKTKKSTKKNTLVGYYIHDGNKIGIRFYGAGACIDDEGALIGDCQVAELANTKFISYAKTEENNEYVILSEEGKVYVVGNGSVVRTIEHNYEDKIEKVGIVVYEDEMCSIKHLIVVRVGGADYLIDEYEKSVYDYLPEKQSISRVFTDNCDNLKDGLTFNIKKGILTSKKRIVKDSETNHELLVNYLLYKQDKKEKIYIIANDKLFITNEEKDRLKAYGEIDEVIYEGEDLSYKLTVTLKSGEQFIFSYE